MGLLYINENGATIGIEANRCTVNYKDGLKRSIPIESLEGITIMGQSQMTAQCSRGVSCSVEFRSSYFSRGGGILWST